MTEFARVVGDTSARHATLPPLLRELHRAVLRQFLAAGTAPTSDWLHGYATELGLEPDHAIAQLHAADLIHLADDAVSVAYPLSGTPTAHRIELAQTPAVYAMCAIDALGIPDMANRDGIITSVDPHTREPIRIERHATAWSWQPAGAVVLRANSGGFDAVHCCMCPYTNFHTSTDTARAYLTAHHRLTGQILHQQAAIDEGRRIFGSLLNA